MNQFTLLVVVLVAFCYFGGKYCPSALKKNKEMLLGVAGGLVLCSFFGLRLEGFKCQFTNRQEIIDDNDCGDGGDVIFENTDAGIRLCQDQLIDTWDVQLSQTGACRRARDAERVRRSHQRHLVTSTASTHEKEHKNDTTAEKIAEARRVAHSLRTGAPVPVDAEERAAWNQRRDPASGPVADRRARIEMYGSDTGPTAADNEADMYGG